MRKIHVCFNLPDDVTRHALCLNSYSKLSVGDFASLCFKLANEECEVYSEVVSNDDKDLF